MTDAFDYLTSRDDADELIAEFGRAVYVRRVVNSGVAWAPTVTPSDHATNAVRVEFSMRQLQRGTVQANDQRWLVAAGPLATAGIVPGPGDKVVIGAAVIGEIVQADPLDPAGVPVLFDCQVRT